MGAIDPHDLLKLNAEVEAGVPFEEAAVSLGLVSRDDSLQERALVDLGHELHLFNAPDFDVDVDPERFKDDAGNFSHGKVAYFLADLYPFATYSDTREVLIYDPRMGTYGPAAPLVGRIVERLLREKTSGHFVKEVLGHLERRSYRSRTEFDAQPGLVVASGVLDPLTGSLEEWDSARLDTVRLPVRFVPSAECPRFVRFVQEVTPEHVSVVQEMMGYCLLKDHRIHRAFLLVGDGANGKSTLQNVMKALLGPANVASVSLQQLAGGDKFAAAHLTGKLANLCADIPSRALRDTGVFKALTGGDLVYAQRKFQDPYEFSNFAKLVFSANRVPLSEDETTAFYRRMTILSFPNTFAGKTANPDLLAGLTTDAELSGILNWAVKGLRRLLRQGDITDAPTVEEARRDYVRRSDPVAAFVEDAVLVDPEGEETKDDLYEAYVHHVRGRGLIAVLNSVFAKDLKRVVSSVREGRPTRNRVRTQVWHGVRLLPREEESGQGSPGRLRHGGQGYQGYFPSKGESEE